MDKIMKDQVNAVYVVTEEHNGSVERSIAIRPQICSHNRVTWEDTGRGRIVDYRKPSDLKINVKNYFNVPSQITINPDTSSVYRLDFLTLDLYNECLKNIVARSPTFNSTEEVQEHYLKMPFE